MNRTRDLSITSPTPYTTTLTEPPKLIEQPNLVGIVEQFDEFPVDVDLVDSDGRRCS